MTNRTPLVFSYFYAENPNQELPFSDTLLNDFQQYDPVRQIELDYKNLGDTRICTPSVCLPTEIPKRF